MAIRRHAAHEQERVEAGNNRGWKRRACWSGLVQGPAFVAAHRRFQASELRVGGGLTRGLNCANGKR